MCLFSRVSCAPCPCLFVLACSQPAKAEQANHSRSSWIDQTGSNMPAGATHADRVAFCAAWCDTVANCKTFGMNDFPPCGPNGDYVYCLASANTWVAGKLQCGIGTGWNGCPTYRDGTVYQYVVSLLNVCRDC